MSPPQNPPLAYEKRKPDVVVLGSGVLGLSIALELLDRGYSPIVVGKDLAGDVTSTGLGVSKIRVKHQVGS